MCIRDSSKVSLSSDVTFLEISANISSAFSDAAWNPSMITDECTSFFIKSSAFAYNVPAKITEEVVPSPTSVSIVLEISTIILAAGC